MDDTSRVKKDLKWHTKGKQKVIVNGVILLFFSGQIEF